jgi:hypothetical protein
MADNNCIKCIYGQSTKKGREVFGSLMPFGKLRRTGAKMCRLHLSARTYTLVTIPYKEKRKIILNNVLSQWGGFTYYSTKNMSRFQVPVLKNTDIYAGFTIQL